MTTFSSCAAALVLAATASSAVAGPDIDMVFGDDLPSHGEVAAELAARWSQTAREGDFGGRPLWQAVGELSYGVNDQFAVGIKLPVTRFDGRWRGNGGYVETKYIAPHGELGFYWGAEVEAGSVKPVGEERTFALEAFPILGYRSGRWHVVANPGLEYSSEGEDKGWSFSPKAKAAYRLNDQHAIGFEYHVEAGKLSDLAPRSKRQETAYLTWDAKLKGQQLSVALGRGTTHASDRWAIRVGIEFDD